MIKSISILAYNHMYPIPILSPFCFISSLYASSQNLQDLLVVLDVNCSLLFTTREENELDANEFGHWCIL